MISFTFLCEVQGFLKSDSKIALQVHSDAALISSATPQALEVIFLETLKAGAILIVFKNMTLNIKHQGKYCGASVACQFPQLITS